MSGNAGNGAKTGMLLIYKITCRARLRRTESAAAGAKPEIAGQLSFAPSCTQL